MSSCLIVCVQLFLVLDSINKIKMNLYVFMLFLDTVAYSGLIVRNGMFQSVCLSVCRCYD